MADLLTCACGCGRDLPPPKPTGRPREYATNACRKNAERRRKSKAGEGWKPKHVSVRDEPVAHILTQGSNTDVDEAVVVVNQLLIVEAHCRRLAVDARPELAWRFAKVAEALAQVLHDEFEGAI